MATPSNTKLNRTGGEESGSRTDTAKENYHAIKLSNPDGSIAFSRIHKRADVTAAVMLETADSEHAFFLDKDGPRKGTTTSISPQRYSVECGKTMKEAEDAMMLFAHNGNIIIRAPNGTIRMEATNIEMVTKGNDTTRGNIKLDASQSIFLDADKNFVVNCKNTNMVSSGTCSMAANSAMTIYGSMIRGVTDACSVKNSKNNNQKTQKTFNQTGSPVER
tara:strand:+ start:1529 stop:2185 length:657 start_codon:yes stop_codon:yes gene_type:complete